MRLTGMLLCGVFFFDGRPFLGSLLLLMQASLLLFPLAALMARHMNERSSVDRILMEVSGAQRAVVEPYTAPAKRFGRA